MTGFFLSFKACVLIIVLSLLCPLYSCAVETADQILQKIYNNQVSDGFQVVVELETPGNSNLEITVLGKTNRDTTKILILFNEPASSKGMKLLFISEKDTDPLLYIYMPQSKQYFQLNGENLNMQIGDSDATLGDLIPMVEWDGVHTLLGIETFMEESCYVMETRREWEGGKRVSRIGAQTLLSYTMEQFDENGKLVKKIETLDTQEISGKICATSLKITNYLVQGKGTVINFLSGDMNIVLPDELFKPAKLKYSYSELMHLGEDIL